MSGWNDVGYHGRLDPYDSAIEIDCPRCKAPEGQRCTNPLTGLQAHLPCIGRVKP